MGFVHLHNHTEYSLLDGATHIRDMVRRAADLGMPAIALTDHGVMSGVPELAQACADEEKETGRIVKPLYGCETYLTLDDPPKQEGGKPIHYHLVLLAKNETGYHNLVRLVSRSHLDYFYYKPQISLSLLEQYAEGLVASSACIQGIVARMLDDDQYDDAVLWAQKLASIFAPGDFYIELQDQGITTRNGHTQHELNVLLTKVARELGLKTIATNDLHYLKKEDAKAQDVLLCIGTGKTLADENRMRFSCEEFYLKTEEEMRAALADFPEACDTTLEVAEKCTVELERQPILPRFPLPEGETEESLFRKEIEAGLHRRYGEELSQEVLDRYEHEASIIIQQGFPAYFLIVQEYIKWAKDQGIVVGPGRGSAAGSIVSYAMGITDLDPLANGLLFERFLSVERVEMPDIDVDFEDGRRDEVIQHVKDVYGDDHVAGVVTYGKLKARNAVRDAARVLGKEIRLGDTISKLIGTDIGITIDEALEKTPELKALYEDNPDYHEVIDAARSIEGQVRNEGVHACAHIICRNKLEDHIPLKRDKKDHNIITQYDGHYTPDLGMLKMDFLGLRTNNVISLTCKHVKSRHGIEIKPDEVPLDEKASFELLGTSNLSGLFQVEGPLYVRLFARMKPRQFSDIVASIALNRPGPMESGALDDFVERRAGKRKIAYYDDRLRPILEETYGTMIYQEQIMQVSMVMSGFSAGKSDRLRKAMGKKNLDIMLQLKEDWMSGAVENGYSEKVATKIWDDAESFAKYAFNKSHSAAYAVVVMRTAYLKAHYPTEFMAATLSSYVGNSKSLIKYTNSCRQNGLPVLPPDVNASGREFTPTDEGIRFGLAGIRGVGEGASDQIIAEREKNGPFTSLHDFLFRVNNTLCNKRTVEALIKSGAFDSTGYTRRQMMRFIEIDNMMEIAAKRHRDRADGQVSLFDMFEESGVDSGFEEDIPAPDGVEWDNRTKLGFEKEILDMYVSGHPLSPYAELLSKNSDYPLSVFVEATEDENDGDLIEQGGDSTEVKVASGKIITLAGMVTGFTNMTSKKGDRMAKFTLEDMEGSIDAIVFPSYFAKAEKALRADDEMHELVIRVRGRYEKSDRGQQVIVMEVQRLDLGEEASSRIRPLELRVPSERFNQQVSNKLTQTLQNYPGRDPVILYLTRSDGPNFRAELPASVDGASESLRSNLEVLLGKGSLR